MRRSERGALVVCATPIGNLGDVTVRVLEEFRRADAIAAEDTRVTRKLLSHYDIHTPLLAYHAHNLDSRTPELVTRIEEGERVALVSDAGTPGVSDPGARLVEACLEAGLGVEVLPGPSAIVTALVASGLPTHAFYFGGFLPRKPGPRRRVLESLAGLEATLVFYESPKRAPKTVADISELWPDRRAALARELTKMYEEVLRDTTTGLAAILAERDLKGEVVLLVGPPVATEREELPVEVLRERVRAYEERGMTTRDAVRRVAEETGASRNAVYEAALSEPPGPTAP